MTEKEFKEKFDGGKYGEHELSVRTWEPLWKSLGVIVGVRHSGGYTTTIQVPRTAVPVLIRLLQKALDEPLI